MNVPMPEAPAASIGCAGDGVDPDRGVGQEQRLEVVPGPPAHRVGVGGVQAMDTDVIPIIGVEVVGAGHARTVARAAEQVARLIDGDIDADPEFSSGGANFKDEEAAGGSLPVLHVSVDTGGAGRGAVPGVPATAAEARADRAHG